MVLIVFFCCLGIAIYLILNFLGVPQIIDWKIMFGIFFVLNIFDWHSTLIVKKEYGPKAEANELLRKILKKGNKLFSMYKLLFAPLIVFSVFYLYQESFSFQVALNFVFVVVVARNYIGYFYYKIKRRRER